MRRIELNERFVRLLTDSGWTYRTDEDEYVKAFQLSLHTGIVDIPICVNFGDLGEDGYAGYSVYSFFETPDLAVSWANARTVVKGKDRVVCMLDYAGLLLNIRCSGTELPISKNLQKK